MSIFMIPINKDLRVNGKDLYDWLFSENKNKSRFNTWIFRRITDYGFVEGEDFCSFLGKSTGGRKNIEYLISLDMAKELCMVEKTPLSKKIRKYFIDSEKQLRLINTLRIKGKDTRKDLTNTIQEMGINEQMHGFGYSNYTKLVYSKAGIEYHKDNNFRDSLGAEQLRVVEQYEKIIDSFLQLGYNYQQIKDQLPSKAIKLLEV